MEKKEELEMKKILFPGTCKDSGSVFVSAVLILLLIVFVTGIILYKSVKEQERLVKIYEKLLEEK